LNSVLSGMGFVCSTGEPCLYTRPGTGVALVIHVDDMIAIGSRAELEALSQELKEKFALKVVGYLGDSWEKFLGREIRRTRGGFAIRLPGAFYDALFETAGLTAGKSVSTPGTNLPQAGEDTPLTPEEHARFRSIVGKLQWASVDRPDLLYSTKQLSHKLASPTLADMVRAKRVVRYIRGTADFVLVLSIKGVRQEPKITTYVDASWCQKSTSCGVITVNGFVVHSYSKTQSVTSLSSCEAELYALNTGVTESKLVQSLLSELGFDCLLTVYTDSSSALALVHRRGLGKLRHVALRQLYLQEQVAAKSLQICKIDGKRNVADIGTKFQTVEVLSKTRALIGLEKESLVFPSPSVSVLETGVPRVAHARYRLGRAATYQIDSKTNLLPETRLSEGKKIYFWPLRPPQEAKGRKQTFT
jgi:hypothetical protein